MEKAYSGFSGVFAIFLLFSAFLCFGGGLWTPHIDDRSVDHVLDVRGVEVLDHLDAGPAVFGDLIDIRTFNKAQADVGMSKAVEGAPLAFAIEFQIELILTQD